MKVSRIVSVVVLLLMGIFPLHAHAVTVRTGEQSIFTQEETTEGSLFISGSRIQVDGEVNGDLFCAGQQVEINGSINGDIICAGQYVNINGPVSGDIRVAGQMVNVENSVSGNISSVAQTFTIAKNASISGEVGVGAQSINLAGTIMKSVYGGGETVSVSGKIKDLHMEVDSLSVLQGASIAGSIEYTSNNQASIAPEATVGGMINKSIPNNDRVKLKVGESSQPRPSNKGIPFLVLTTTFGALLLIFLKKRTLTLTQTMQQNIGITFIRGLLYVVLVPVALLLLIITLIGIPLAVISVLILIFVYFIARALSAIIVGLFIIDKLWESKKGQLGWSLIAGVIVLWALLQIPIIGGFTSLIITLYGFGGVTYVFFPKKK